MYKNRFIDMTTFDGIMPNEWHVGTVSEIIKFHDSKRVPLSSRERTYLEKIYPYYGATSVMDYVDRYLFDGVYLLIGEDGTVIDNKGFPVLQYVEGKFWVNNHAHIITGKNGYSVEILYLLFSMTNVQSIVTGAVQPKISAMLLKNLAPEVLARTSNFLGLLFTLSIPVGTACFSLIAVWNIQLTWMLFVGLSLLAILLTVINLKNDI